jgi:hypothetical protein
MHGLSGRQGIRVAPGIRRRRQVLELAADGHTNMSDTPHSRPTVEAAAAPGGDMTALSRRHILAGAAATVAAAALPAAAIAREQMTAVVHFGRWRDGRAVTADESGWRNGTIIVIGPYDDRLELGRIIKSELRPDGAYDVSFDVLRPGEVPAVTAILCEAALDASADQWIEMQNRHDL